MKKNLHKKASLVLKIAVTIFVLILVPIYLYNYGWRNFLWLSDLGLFLTVVALWLESPFLISLAMVAILPIEIAWNIDFILLLITGRHLFGMAQYMFDPQWTLFLRGLSLFHVAVPIIWIWYFFKWGYDKRVFIPATIFMWVVLLVTYVCTYPHDNINWVFAPAVHQWTWVSPHMWVLLLMIGFPLFIFLPMHMLLKRYARPH